MKKSHQPSGRATPKPSNTSRKARVLAALLAESPSGEGPFLCREQVAVLLGVSSPTVLEWAASGKLPTTLDSEGRPQIAVDDLLTILRNAISLRLAGALLDRTTNAPPRPKPQPKKWNPFGFF
jgi:hypothetical protein